MNIIKLINDNIFTILIVLLISIAFFLQTYFEIEHLINKENIKEQVNQNTDDINKNNIKNTIQNKLIDLQSQVTEIKTQLNKTNNIIQTNYSEFKILNDDYTNDKQQIIQAVDTSAKKTSDT